MQPIRTDIGLVVLSKPSFQSSNLTYLILKYKLGNHGQPSGLICIIVTPDPHLEMDCIQLETGILTY